MKLPTHYKLGMAALCTVALLGVSLAQQPDKAAEAKKAVITAAVAPTPIAGKATLGLTVAEDALIAPGWRASKLLKTDVYNDTNQKIGKIDDFIVAPEGKLSVAVIEVGGFLGVGAHRVAVPVQQFAYAGPKIVLAGATREALKELPEFKYLQ